ncbi:MAG: M1 family peptidase [Sphingobacteriales bacterium]|nr:MAG: M1 family peptidase [Sphingobacteriales bacterium]TAF80115.1 MAG: M1 family peptidase [Sphingobacteriales bacterium]
MKKLILCLFGLGCFTYTHAQFLQNNPNSNHGNKFEQLETILHDPNIYRSASGAPGPKYWQQKADYLINCEINDKTQVLTGQETITYTNNSPDNLTYLWLQLDENEHKNTSDKQYINGSAIKDKLTTVQIEAIIGVEKGLGVNILKVADANNNLLTYTINQTMMRVELPTTLLPKQKFVFKINWNYKITDRSVLGGRGGYEYFADDDNYLYTITQWYPRMAVYSDFQGWQNKQFSGSGEFALTFGDFKVNITVPADHIIGATGQCTNYTNVLSGSQLQRWKQAQNTNEPIEVVTLTEANKAIKSKSTTKKTWMYEAKNVRDFAFVSSRRLVWDAMQVKLDGGNRPMAMSYYCPEAYSLYRKYSTKLVAHTLKVYSKHTITYPYPVAISVEANNGMEYPMICFNYGRPEKDGTYSEAVKYGMMGVIIHEVGHNFFPMIINSDERQWTWMDEGMNTFCQYLAEQEWDNNYPSRRGPAHLIANYMRLPKDQLEPIMTNSENIVQFGANAYGKPATALNILRETVMGRKLFDYAFKEYARRWAFKHPTPSDFFRTMEDASAVDLDWFWRGWFYGTDAVDIAIDGIKYFRMDSKNPETENQLNKKADDNEAYVISRKRNRDEGIKFAVEADTSLQDFYNKWDKYAVSAKANQNFITYYKGLSADEKKLYDNKINFYQVDFSNKGGLVMPIILEWTYTDGTKDVEYIPAYIWRKDENKVTKVFAKAKQVASLRLDPYRETADIDESNNNFPKVLSTSKFEMFKQQSLPRGSLGGSNPMQQDAKK